MKKILFIISNEVARRAIEPLLKILNNNGHFCKILENQYSLRELERYSEKIIDEKFAKNYIWDFIISSNPVNKSKFTGKIVSIPHGSMYGNNAWSLKRASNADIYFGISPHELVYMKNHLGNAIENIKFIPSGNPANDLLKSIKNLENKDFIELRNKKREALGLSNNRTILLSSHWTSRSNLRTFGTGLLEALIWNFPDHQIICTTHPNLLNSPKSEFSIDTPTNTPHFEADWLIKALKSKASKRVKIFLNRSPSDLLFVSDIFIGDHSSLVAQAAYLDLPLIIYNRGGLNYFDKEVAEIVNSESHQFENIEQLLGWVKYFDNEKVEKVDAKSIKEMFMYNVGGATRTIFKNLITL